MRRGANSGTFVYYWGAAVISWIVAGYAVSYGDAVAAIIFSLGGVYMFAFPVYRRRRAQRAPNEE